MDNGAVIEYLDTNEIENSQIAMTYADLMANHQSDRQFVRYTHCEIHPMMMMGVVASMIPFSDHNQSPRNCYQCLWKNEEVVMADGSLKKIGDIRVGDQVITVNPETLEQTPVTVINQYVKATEKKIVEVSTVSGRKLICTEDHPVLTYTGWKTANSLTKTDLVCVCPTQIQHPEDKSAMILKEYVRYLQNGYTSNQMSIDTWLTTIRVAGQSIFVPIDQINAHENVEIADITVDSDTHSFITGQQICVHNSSMAKQAIGYYVTNYNSRMDTMAHVLAYGHKPLVTTCLGRYTMMDRLPHGATAMLLYACYTGYNQEDSIVINQDAVDRGFFNTIFFRTYVDKAQKHRSVTTATEKFTNPSKCAKCKCDPTETYHAIDDNGCPIVGKEVKSGDVVIGKIIELKEKEQEFNCKDASTSMRHGEEGLIDLVIPDAKARILPYNAEGERIVKARVASRRKPIKGDKFASRYSQKGTIGMLYRTGDLPFTSSGLVPDLIMNPHGIPSRMTVGKLLETLLGKIAVCTGKIQDATPFISYDFNQFRQTLKQYQLDEVGEEVMYNGQTGEMFEASFFYGPTYYQRLKHMVLDKIHCLDMTHEVLTADGWKFFPQLTMEDYIATLKDDQLVFEQPIKLLYYPDYSGKMYRIKTPEIDLCVTPNHRMWVSTDGVHYQFERADQISGSRYYLMIAEDDNNAPILVDHDSDLTISDYTGAVFCLQVPSEVFYVRRNGLHAWTGNSRESGPIQLLTRQPAEGRSRDGGLRLGEMERDCFIAHGIPKFLKEKMMDSSDLFKAYVSKKEEALIVGNPGQHLFKFNGQRLKDDVVRQIQIPYAMKLLLQELESMGLDVRMQVS